MEKHWSILIGAAVGTALFGAGEGTRTGAKLAEHIHNVASTFTSTDPDTPNDDVIDVSPK